MLQSPTSQMDSLHNLKYRKRAVDSYVTPARAFLTPPQKKVHLYSPNVPSPLVFSIIEDQSTPAPTIVIASCIASTVEYVDSLTVSTASLSVVPS
uniref:Uncharacterized protein n=1 Tax=Amphimedon queenslandica TaxID=400682 RepID=A0A1X7UXJ0_AMPQE